ncbi:MAG: MopE-related protein [bacterium]|nr:MopE-related protein [bacterium]
MRRYVVMAALTSLVGACAMDFGPLSDYLACDADGACATRYRCAQTSLGAVCLDDAQWALRCGSDEVCDGADNDCDGEVDEGFDGLGESCSVGVGACERTGETLCATDGSAPRCSVTAGAPVAEVCNGRDDDCDGATDEDLNERHFGTAVGECQEEIVTCVTGVEDTIQQAQHSKNEACDDLDNDCDGATDEDFGDLGTACAVGEGVCRAMGTITCAPRGGGTACNAEPGIPTVDLCDGLDNNCDGEVDELFMDELSTPCTVGVGPCQRNGTTVCSDDGFRVVCDAMPGDASAEICDGLDNNCDGVVDDGFGDACCVPDTERYCSTEIGACTIGRQRCDAGRAWGTCTGTMPAAEVCDTVDNDCDGAVDEDIVDCCQPGTITSCSTMVGTCVVGEQRCGADQKWQSCTGTLPSPDFCDGRDNNCDGTVDELYAAMLGIPCSVGIGPCRADGVTVCTADGFSVVCGAVPGDPSAEMCDGIDNDCNGERDDGLGDGCCQTGLTRACSTEIGQCTTGTQECIARAWGACSGLEPTDEACDGDDNDCDGTVDEGLLDCCIPDTRVSCSTGEGACVAGEQWCDATFSWGACSGTMPEPDLCDGADNDCDGNTDEQFGCVGEPCTVGRGVCQRSGTSVCSADGMHCDCDVVAGDVSAEVCDGADNDCDGFTDEPWDAVIGDTCSIGTGACERTGEMRCAPDGSGAVCDAEIMVPVDETCDGTDNDCDGNTDEGVDGCCDTGIERPCAFTSGTCIEGVQDCIARAWGLCSGTFPSQEVCDGVDNDCDGDTDEPWSLLVDEECSVGRGACERTGVWSCAGDTAIACSVASGSMTTERCDGVDNDCDGATDELDDLVPDITGTNVGACQQGVTACIGGVPTVIAIEIEPTDEVCDGLDNDCNDAVDDGFPDEVCDGADNDCDGDVDEPWSLLLGEECDVGRGVCERTGVWGCAGDTAIACSVAPGDATTETCDGVDNDCDGNTDEGIPMVVCYNGPESTEGIGVCRTGTTLCADGVRTCVGAVYPSAEWCNGFDEDCDGAADATVDGTGNIFPLVQPCYSGPPDTLGIGACTNGLQTCMPYIGLAANVPVTQVPVYCSIEPDECRTAWWGVCDGEVLPTQEICGDTLDSDCDGRDNGMTFLEDFEDDCAMPEATVTSDVPLTCVQTPVDTEDPNRTPIGSRSLAVDVTYQEGTTQAVFEWPMLFCASDVVGGVRIFPQVMIGGANVGMLFQAMFATTALVRFAASSEYARVEVVHADGSSFMEDLGMVLAMGRWYHITWQFTEGERLAYFIDGVLVFETVLDVAIEGTRLRLVASSSTARIAMVIDEVSFVSPP